MSDSTAAKDFLDKEPRLDTRELLVFLMRTMRQRKNLPVTEFVTAMETYYGLRRLAKPWENVTYRRLVKGLRALEERK